MPMALGTIQLAGGHGLGSHFIGLKVLHSILLTSWLCGWLTASHCATSLQNLECVSEYHSDASESFTQEILSRSSSQKGEIKFLQSGNLLIYWSLTLFLKTKNYIFLIFAKHSDTREITWTAIAVSWTKCCTSTEIDWIIEQFASIKARKKDFQK